MLAFLTPLRRLLPLRELSEYVGSSKELGRQKARRRDCPVTPFHCCGCDGLLRSYPLRVVARALVNQAITASSSKISWILGFKPCLFMIFNVCSSNVSDGVSLECATLSTKSRFRPVNLQPFARNPSFRSATV